MTEQMSPSRTTPSQRSAWRIGGGLLVLSAMVNLSAMYGALAPLGQVGMLLFSAALLLFAWGVRGAGSITARRALGTAALVAWALWPLLVGLLWSVLPTTVLSSPDSSFLGTGLRVVELGLAIVAVTQIGRAAVVPRPWNWAPLWGLAVVVALRLLTMTTTSVTHVRDQTLLVSVHGATVLIESVVLVTLGVLAIVLSMRPVGERAVVVFPAPQ